MAVVVPNAEVGTTVDVESVAEALPRLTEPPYRVYDRRRRFEGSARPWYPLARYASYVSSELRYIHTDTYVHTYIVYMYHI